MTEPTMKIGDWKFFRYESSCMATHAEREITVEIDADGDLSIEADAYPYVPVAVVAKLLEWHRQLELRRRRPSHCETCGNAPNECTCGVCGICCHTFAACDCAETHPLLPGLLRLGLSPARINAPWAGGFAPGTRGPSKHAPRAASGSS